MIKFKSKWIAAHNRLRHAKTLRQLGFCALALSSLFSTSGCGGNATDPDEVQAIVEEAESRLKAYDFGAAFKLFSKINPSELNEESTYAYALSAWHSSPPSSEHLDLALSMLSELAKSKNTELAAQALLDMARIYEVKDYSGDEVDLEKSRQLYVQASEVVGGESSLYYQAIMRLAQSYAQELTPAEVKSGGGGSGGEDATKPEPDDGNPF
jgi:hypothetical protein